MPERRSELRLDWASHAAARAAVTRWHYSRSLPTGKLVKVGAWEDGRFVGVVIFSRGATPNIGRPYGLEQTAVCELTRVALGNHATPTSRVVAIALRFLLRRCPGLRLVVSYADADQGHHGGIYQAGGWIYVGTVLRGQRSAFVVHGRKVHPKTVHSMGGEQSLAWVRAHLDPQATEHRGAGKHKYLMPLDAAMRRRVAALAQPYPKRSRAGSADSGTSPIQGEGGGASPTSALHSTSAGL